MKTTEKLQELIPYIQPGSYLRCGDFCGDVVLLQWTPYKEPEVDVRDKKDRSLRIIPISAIGDHWFPVVIEKNCCKSKIQEYNCQMDTGLGFGVDKCLLAEIKALSGHGIETIGCCCGHGKLRPYIQVKQDHCKLMEDLGYQRLELDTSGNGQWCYDPKTILLTSPERKTLDCETTAPALAGG